MKFFTSTENLKKQYRDLCKKLHPDFGGDEETFKQMSNEYQDLMMKGFDKTFKAENNNQDISEDLKEILKSLIHIETLEIELIGSWIWVSGNTYEYKDLLKEQGFKWNNKRKKWYYTEQEYRRYNAKGTFEDIRKTYGSQVIKTKSQSYLGA